MKLEVGMFVRFKTLSNEVKIGQIQLIDNSIYELDNNEVTADKYIIKASHNIIDLIEVMDLMFIDISPDDCGGIVVPRIAETINELEQWKEHISNGYWILKGIVAKEQIESARYKVGE